MNDEVSSYLRDRHARVSTPRQVIDDLVRRATGSAIDELGRIIRGYVNEVYRVRTTSGAEFCVRLRRFGESEHTVEWEAWAMGQARGAGAPVADVLLAERLRLDDTEVPAMVLEWMPGTPLARVEPQLSEADLRRVCVAMGTAFATINSVPVGGLWLPTDDGDWPEMTSEQMMAGYAEMIRSERADAYTGGLTADEFERTLQLLRIYGDEFPCKQAVLCHNDMSPEHVLVDDDLRITGVIDFGNWCGAADVGDLGHLLYARPDLELAPFLEGYGSPQRTDATFLTRVRLQALTQAIGHLTHEVRETDWERAAVTARTLRSLLDALSPLR